MSEEAGPTDVVDLVCELAQDERSRSVLESGQNLETFERMVQMRGETCLYYRVTHH